MYEDIITDDSKFITKKKNSLCTRSQQVITEKMSLGNE
jgi:hypothetical protein